MVFLVVNVAFALCADRTPNNLDEIIRHTPTVPQTYAKLSSISYYEVITR